MKNLIIFLAFMFSLTVHSNVLDKVNFQNMYTNYKRGATNLHYSKVGIVKGYQETMKLEKDLILCTNYFSYESNKSTYFCHSLFVDLKPEIGKCNERFEKAAILAICTYNSQANAFQRLCERDSYGGAFDHVDEATSQLLFADLKSCTLPPL